MFRGYGNFRKYTRADALFDQAFTSDDSPSSKPVLRVNRKFDNNRIYHSNVHNLPSSNAADTPAVSENTSTADDSSDVIESSDPKRLQLSYSAEKMPRNSESSRLGVCDAKHEFEESWGSCTTEAATRSFVSADESRFTENKQRRSASLFESSFSSCKSNFADTSLNPCNPHQLEGEKIDELDSRLLELPNCDWTECMEAEYEKSSHGVEKTAEKESSLVSAVEPSEMKFSCEEGLGTKNLSKNSKNANLDGRDESIEEDEENYNQQQMKQDVGNSALVPLLYSSNDIEVVLIDSTFDSSFCESIPSSSQMQNETEVVDHNSSIMKNDSTDQRSFQNDWNPPFEEVQKHKKLESEEKEKGENRVSNASVTSSASTRSLDVSLSQLEITSPLQIVLSPEKTDNRTAELDDNVNQETGSISSLAGPVTKVVTSTESQNASDHGEKGVAAKTWLFSRKNVSLCAKPSNVFRETLRSGNHRSTIIGESHRSLRYSLHSSRRVLKAPVKESNAEQTIDQKLPTVEPATNCFESVKLEALGEKDCLASEQQSFSSELKMCKEENLLPFESIMTLIDPDDVCKIGEGSFSEVYKVVCSTDEQETEKCILKVIALSEEFDEINAEGEFQIAYSLSQLCCNYVKFFWSRHLTGKCPVALVDAWTRFHHSNPDESLNICPSDLPEETRFCAMAMEHAGTPFADFKFKKFDQAASIIQQLACSLAMGETLLQFEHRDLHMSNIMVKHTRDKVYTYEVAATSCDVTDRDNCGACRKTKQVTVDTKGIKLTIIDYTLSRLLVQGQLKYNDLSSAANAELFQKTENEEEHCRIYRNMKELVGNQWDSFVPETNVHWLYHITDQLLYYKKKTDFHTYDPTKREKLKKVYLELSSSKFKSCVDVILNSKLLKL